MFGRLFGKKDPAPAGPTDPVLSMVLFAAAPAIDGEAVAKAASALEPATKIELMPGGKPDEPMRFEGEGAFVMAMVMPREVPGDEVASAGECSPFWASEERSTQHAAHVLLMAVSDEGEPVAARLATRVARAMLQLPGAVAWYVGGGGLLHPPEMVEEVYDDTLADGVFPTPLWVNVQMQPSSGGKDKVDAITVGMDELGQREFEVVGTSMELGELAGTLLDLATYTLMEGPVLKHGETFGRSEEERWRIEVGASKLQPKLTVTRLKIP